MTYDASNPRHVREAQKAQRFSDVQRLDVVRGILSVVAGRRWVWELLGSCSIFHSTYNDVPERMAYNEGRRSVGLQLLADAVQFPESYSLMVREANERDAAHDARRSHTDSRVDPGTVGIEPAYDGADEGDPD